MTVLGVISTLLRVQKRDIDVAAINPALSGMKDRITSAEEWKTHYQTELSKKLAKTKDGAGAVNSVTFKGQSLSMSKYSKKLSVEVDDIRKDFCHNTVKNIEDRLPKEAVYVAMAFHVLGMCPLTHLSKEQREDYGSKELEEGGCREQELD